MTLKQIAEETGCNRITELKRSGKFKCIVIQPASFHWKTKDASDMAKIIARNLKRHGIVKESLSFKSKKPKSKNGWVSNILTIIARYDGKYDIK